MTAQLPPEWPLLHSTREQAQRCFACNPPAELEEEPWSESDYVELAEPEGEPS